MECQEEVNRILGVESINSAYYMMNFEREKIFRLVTLVFIWVTFSTYHVYGA